ncbi:MAG: 23S rRNA (pseudouridine(1915)-N(3))-methyltransferase RlmH [Gammaproteobacteria bacterium]|nr:MAG: 23S rRNA (pseudouridine(1915)-N(3))-methyltransferase RlmH [Gammaproteobacteria bacterium]
MKITIIAIGDKLPNWVREGVGEYTKRFTPMHDFSLEIKEIAAKKRSRHANIANITEQESQALIQAVPKHSIIIALDVGGKRLSSERLAAKLENYHNNGDNLAILIGGPEGFNDSVRQLARERWSLSDLTLPHPIARIVLAETLYRSVSIIHNHPYHRGGEQ